MVGWSWLEKEHKIHGRGGGDEESLGTIDWGSTLPSELFNLLVGWFLVWITLCLYLY